jgi:serine O-acetyltransferase
MKCGTLTAMLSTLRRDIAAALKNDPAARSVKEVVLAYPGVHALALHRVARLLAHQARFLTGVEIHPGAQISAGVFIDHGMGVVIGETAVIEEGCIIYKGVVLGGTSLERKVRHPHLAKNVIIGSNACVLGAIHVGEGARVGSGSVVINDVPAGATVRGVTPHDVLDHASLPDPVMEVLRGLAAQQEALNERLSKLEGSKAQRDEDSPRAKVGRIF